MALMDSKVTKYRLSALGNRLSLPHGARVQQKNRLSAQRPEAAFQLIPP